MSPIIRPAFLRYLLIACGVLTGLSTVGKAQHPAGQQSAVEGLISIWLRDDGRLSDGGKILIWSTENDQGCTLRLETPGNGMLRAVLNSPEGTIVARTGLTGWARNEWHFVSVGWTSFGGPDGSGVGTSGSLVLWVDKVAMDGPIVPFGFSIHSGNVALNPEKISGFQGISLESSLIIRNGFSDESKYGMVACVYRDYFRTAPYDEIRICTESARVPSDLRAVAGFMKPFGLEAHFNGRWEPVTENVVRYSQWAYFDAKPYISWTTSDPAIATIDSSGRLLARSTGTCMVSARFHDLSDHYRLTVINSHKPDAGVICISLEPSYRSDAARIRPEPGDTLHARLNFGNFGTEPLPAGLPVRFSLIPVLHGNQPPAHDQKAARVFEFKTKRLLHPGEQASEELTFILPPEPVWMKLELDPRNRFDEFCEANNQICERTDARPIQMGYRPADLRSGLSDQKINHVGSLSFFDWIRAEKLRMDVMLREAVWPTTGPMGVDEAYRIDRYTELTGTEWDQEPWNLNAIWFDGGFPINEPVDLMSVDCAIIHEFGHTILSQPDLYGYPVKASNVFVLDGSGQPVAGTPVMPVVDGRDLLPASGGINVPAYLGYPSLMDGCQLWLHPSQAGHIMHYKGYRPDRFWGTQGRLIPGRANWLMVKDRFDQPLRNAAVYVYQVSQAPVEDSGEKYFANRPKFTGQTDSDGRFIFPMTTDSLWDDPETDETDGAVEIWNPFGTKTRETAFTPNVWTVEGLLLIRVTAGEQSEYHFMDLTQFNTEYLSGNTVLGRYPLKTSLVSPDMPTVVVPSKIPEAIRKFNKRPVAIAPPSITVKCGQIFEIDGSRSFDPEGQPLIYRWNSASGWLQGNLSQAPVLQTKAPDKPGIAEYKFWVLDGVRCSEPVRIRVNVMQ